MKLIYICLAVFLLCFPLVRYLLFNFPRILWGLFPDIYYYLIHKKWNECRAFGQIVCYTGLFGQGKTKECVRHVVNQYKQFNGRKIWDFEKHCFVEQHVVVYSNVHLNIPYIKLTSIQQLVDCQGSGLSTINLFLIDEASVVFNSRDFKNNFSVPALNTILTSRHHRIGIFLTSQRFGHMDALLRQVTSYVYECHYFKPFRTQQVKVFNAWEVENCTNLLLLKPLRTFYTYTSNAVYALYDTYAMVSEISKKCVEGGFIPDSEVLANQGVLQNDIKQVSRARRKLSKRM